MARISTYEIDTVIHDDDNIVGTDNRPGGRQETRLFPISALSSFITRDVSSVWPTGLAGDAGDAEREEAAVEYISTTFSAPIYNGEELATPAKLPREIYEHNLGTLNVIVKVYESSREDIALETDPDLDHIGTFVDAYREFTPLRVVIINENEVLVDFGSIEPFTGFIVILG